MYFHNFHGTLIMAHLVGNSYKILRVVFVSSTMSKQKEILLELIT